MVATALFFDLETTGLDPKSTVILEVGARVVDEKLNVLDSLQMVVGHFPIPPMDEWCLKTHGKSGLLREVSESDNTIGTVEFDLCKWVDRWFPGGKIILAGNTIGYDRSYVKLHLMDFEKKLHYRMLDVTALYLAESLFGTRCVPKVEGAHRALADVDASIALLKALL